MCIRDSIHIVLIFDPNIIEVIKTRSSGIKLIIKRNINLLSFKLVFIFNLLFKKINIINNGIKIPICLTKNVIGSTT